MKYRLAPFCHWFLNDGALIIETPDHRLKLKPEAEELLVMLRDGRVEETPAIKALAEYRVVVGSESRELRLLRRLERYFKAQHLTVSSVRKGSTIADAALPRECYMFKVESRTEGHGQARGKNLAMLKAAVEVYERLSSDALYNEALLVSAESDIQPLDYGLFVKYRDWQLTTRGFPYGETPSGQWAIVREVLTNRPYKLPLEMVCYPDRIGNQRVTSASSNGVACHPIYQTAVLGSAYELIERDAFMLHWFWKASREQITAPPLLRRRIDRLKKLGFECIFLNLTLELAPVVLVILHRQAEKYPRLLLGMASHALPIVAMDKALQEVELNVTFYGYDTPTVERPQDIRKVIDHRLWYDRLENHVEVLSLIASGQQININDITPGCESIEALDALIRQNGFKWYVSELNTIGRQSTGLYVIRSLIEGLIPISFGYIMEPLGLQRILQSPTSTESSKFSQSRQSVEGYKVQPFA